MEWTHVNLFCYLVQVGLAFKILSYILNGFRNPFVIYRFLTDHRFFFYNTKVQSSHLQANPKIAIFHSFCLSLHFHQAGVQANIYFKSHR
jgi:hypothetical protein